ncbi:hypothetical protein F0P96_05010 [Hymenobacter busanensis]|uniref:DUF6438 domain-containing protein n=1 Tax=Hymenobacter busanensis TaxID=2607656 RepID=A0A7L5A248_9BACT|nr:DUF6438 domain-containing protein [Hymenobacter busanensis]KAA9338208.1 hypothetical protein F0P96_05010 [Hymenobacter busanensis]QHJ09367.1 hypothetical protein GUY19_19600 [Hymenobacter busanensis]
MRLPIPAYLTALLLSAALLPACTVNYYVTDKQRGPRPYGGDVVYSGGGNTPGPVYGSYPGNGASSGSTQPGPVRTTPPATRPPVRPQTPTGGGRPPVYETGGHKPEPPTGNSGGSKVERPPVYQTGGHKPEPPAGGTATGGTKVEKEPVYQTGGHKPEPPSGNSTTGGTKLEKEPVYQTGGHKPEPPAVGASHSIGHQPETTAGTSPAGGPKLEREPVYQTGGHKPEPPARPEGVTQQPEGEQSPVYETGGHKPEPPIRKNIRTRLTPATNPADQPMGSGGTVKAVEEGPMASMETSSPGRGEASEEAPVIVFRKTPCFGPCPHYEASIWASGRVHYVGYRNVAKEGTYELKLPAATVTEMLRQAQEVGFSKLQDQYLSGATDMPSTYLTINRKTVQVEQGAPDEVMALLNFIDFEVGKVSGGPKQ